MSDSFKRTVLDIQYSLKGDNKMLRLKCVLSSTIFSALLEMDAPTKLVYKVVTWVLPLIAFYGVKCVVIVLVL